MNQRRAFMRLLLAGAAGAAVLRSSPASAASTPSAAPAVSLFGTLSAGASLGLGWALHSVGAPANGAILVTLLHDSGRSVRVDLCLREGAAQGPAATEYLDFIVMDGAREPEPTDESLGRVLRRLAAIVAEHEGAALDAVAALLPLADRAWRYPETLELA